nr:uncharacterized protein LOC106689607 isoform X2 [Halyomorpha halys]
MWLLKKKCLFLFHLPFHRRLKFNYILPHTTKNSIIICSNFQYGYETDKYWGLKHVLSWCDIMKYRLQYLFNDIQNNLFRFNLMMILSPLQWAHLILLESDAINEIKNSNIRHCQYNDDKMCEMVKELWLKGNIVASFIQFSSLYDKEDKNFQTKLIKTLQGLICLSVDKGGMAIVANITEHVKKFSHEKNEMSVLVTLWYALFNSSLYDDNCLSDTLLEDPNFKAYLEPLIPCFGADFLKHNEVGSYQRLIETSLTHNLDNAAGMLLRLLFNYYYIKETMVS